MGSGWGSLYLSNLLLRNLNSFVDFNALGVSNELLEVLWGANFRVEGAVKHADWILDDQKNLTVHNGLLEIFKPHDVKILWL